MEKARFPAPKASFIKRSDWARLASNHCVSSMASFLRCGRRFAAVAASRTFTFRTLHVAPPLRALRGPVTVLQGQLSLIPQRRLLASDAPALSLKEVGDRIIDVLKKFDKVDPSKVTTLFPVQEAIVTDVG